MIESPAYPLPETRVARPSHLGEQRIIRGLAFHEAGHGVTGLTLGLNLIQVRVFPYVGPVAPPESNPWTGVTNWAPSWAPELDRCIQCEAGAVADRRQLVEAGLGYAADDGPALHDRAVAEAICAQTGYRIDWPRVTRDTIALVDRLWPRITAVAEAIIASPDRTLTGEQVADIIGRTAR